MLEFVLTRKIIGPGYMKGELAIEGTTFRCLTLEAKDPRGHQQAANVALTYAIPAGKYPVIYRVYSYFPLTPYIICKPYKKISLVMYQKFFKPGCIAVGKEYAWGKLLMGFDEVMEGLQEIVRKKYHPYGSLIVNYDNHCTYEEEDLEVKDYNFLAREEAV